MNKSKEHIEKSKVIPKEELKVEQKQASRKDAITSPLRTSKLEVNMSPEIHLSQVKSPITPSKQDEQGQRVFSPKPPKPVKRGTSEEKSNSINLSQLLLETKPQEGAKHQKKVVVRPPSNPPKKIKIVNIAKVKKIDINNLKLSKEGKAPILKLKKAQIESKSCTLLLSINLQPIM